MFGSVLTFLELTKGKRRWRVAPEGAKSEDGTREKRGDKWVPIKQGKGYDIPQRPRYRDMKGGRDESRAWDYAEGIARSKGLRESEAGRFLDEGYAKLAEAKAENELSQAQYRHLVKVARETEAARKVFDRKYATSEKTRRLHNRSTGKETKKTQKDKQRSMETERSLLAVLDMPFGFVWTPKTWAEKAILELDKITNAYEQIGVRPRGEINRLKDRSPVNVRDKEHPTDYVLRQKKIAQSHFDSLGLGQRELNSATRDLVVRAVGDSFGGYKVKAGNMATTNDLNDMFAVGFAGMNVGTFSVDGKRPSAVFKEVRQALAKEIDRRLRPLPESDGKTPDQRFAEMQETARKHNAAVEQAKKKRAAAAVKQKKESVAQLKGHGLKVGDMVSVQIGSSIMGPVYADGKIWLNKDGHAMARVSNNRFVGTKSYYLWGASWNTLEKARRWRVAPEGAISEDGKREKRGDKWVPIKGRAPAKKKDAPKRRAKKVEESKGRSSKQEDTKPKQRAKTQPKKRKRGKQAPQESIEADTYTDSFGRTITRRSAPDFEKKRKEASEKDKQAVQDRIKILRKQIREGRGGEYPPSQFFFSTADAALDAELDALRFTNRADFVSETLLPAGVGDYLSSNYDEVNRNLREGEALTKRGRVMYKDMMDSMGNLSTNTKVVRHISVEADDPLVHLYLEEGQHIPVDSFLSTSSNVERGPFARDYDIYDLTLGFYRVEFQIDCPKNATCLVTNEQQQEIIFPPDQYELEVKDVEAASIGEFGSDLSRGEIIYHCKLKPLSAARKRKLKLGRGETTTSFDTAE